MLTEKVEESDLVEEDLGVVEAFEVELNHGGFTAKMSKGEIASFRTPVQQCLHFSDCD